MEDPNPSPWGHPSNSKLTLPRSFTLLANTSDSIRITPQVPDWWLVSVGAAAGVRVLIVSGPNPITAPTAAGTAGDYWDLRGGGSAMVVRPSH